ncbi:SLC13 family permease [Pseudogemmobacter sonorensis]|uniref:SLC13 family permease n=1 Tax=Pseudogemmobacter sonorensis TaxID=2989681 RepID=UPI00369CE8B8
MTFSAKHLLLALAVLVALVLAVAAPPMLAPDQARILGIVLVTLVLWGTSLVPGYLASLIFFAVLLVFGLAPPDLVFAGFQSTAVWLIVSGFVIGAAISISGIGAMLARGLAPLLSGSYPRLIGGLMAVSVLLSFVMPSSVGRAVVMVPVGMALAERMGFGPGSKGRIGIASVLAIGTNMPGFTILPSNIPNMVLSGAAETIHGMQFGYMDYLLLHFPVLGLLKAAAVVLLVLWMFPATPGAPLPPREAAKADRPVSGAARIRVAVILAATLALWMTDSLHGVNSAWIGLVAAVLLLLPGVGIVTPPAFKASVDFGMLLFVAGALALGALVNASGLGAILGQWLIAVLPLAPGADAVNFASLSLMSAMTGLVTTVPGVPAVLTPMAGDLAAQTGFDLNTVLMTQVIGFSTVIFPYQVGPLVVAMQMSGERLNHLLRITVPLAAITFLVLLPLDFLWWRLLGAL